MPAPTSRRSYPLRLDERTRSTLRIVAEQLGLPINVLITDILARELEILSFSLEGHLTETVKALREYRGEGAEEDWAAFALAEVDEDDPIRTRLVETLGADRYGLAEIFA